MTTGDRDIVSLITKLNDRNIQKQRESGFTRYALLAALAVIIVCIVDLLPDLVRIENRYEKVYLFAITCNVSLGLIVIVSIYLATMGYSQSSKLVSKRFLHESFLEVACAFLVIIIPIVATIIAAWSRKIKFNEIDWPLLILLVVLLIAMRLFFDKSRFQADYYLSEDSGVKEKDTGKKYVLLYVAALVYIIIALVAGIDINITKNNVGAIKLGLYVSVIPVLLDMVFVNKNRSIKTKALEELEVDIFVQNYSDSQIRKILQENYIGIGLEEWVLFKQQKFEEYVQVVFSQINDFKLRFNEVVSDPNEKEKKQRINRILEELYSKKSNVRKSFSEFFEELDVIWANNLHKEERKKISELAGVYRENRLKLFHAIDAVITLAQGLKLSTKPKKSS